MSQIFWRQSSQACRGTPCLFLDRDGVVVEEVGYLHRASDVRLLPGVVETLLAARSMGWAVGLVTNQAGVGRGYYDWNAFEVVQATIAEMMGLGPEPFDFIAACGTHAEARHPHLRIEDHPWRKPNSGMLRMAEEAFALDMVNSVMVGDQLSDMQAGLAAGVGRLVHVRSGHGAAAREEVTQLQGHLTQGRLILLEGLAELPFMIDRTPPFPTVHR